MFLICSSAYGSVVPIPTSLLASSTNNVCDSIVLPVDPTHNRPGVRLGISFVLSIDDTTKLPSLDVLTLPTLPMFCIKFPYTGFVVVSAAPDVPLGFTYITSFSVGVTPSIGSVIRFLNLPVTTAKPSSFIAKSCFSNPTAGILRVLDASANCTSNLPDAPTEPDIYTGSPFTRAEPCMFLTGTSTTSAPPTCRSAKSVNVSSPVASDNSTWSTAPSVSVVSFTGPFKYSVPVCVIKSLDSSPKFTLPLKSAVPSTSIFALKVASLVTVMVPVTVNPVAPAFCDTIESASTVPSVPNIAMVFSVPFIKSSNRLSTVICMFWLPSYPTRYIPEV